MKYYKLSYNHSFLITFLKIDREEVTYYDIRGSGAYTTDTVPKSDFPFFDLGVSETNEISELEYKSEVIRAILETRG